MCLAQGQNPVMMVRLKPATLLFQDKHSTTEPLRSLTLLRKNNISQNEINSSFSNAFQASTMMALTLEHYSMLNCVIKRQFYIGVIGI